MPERSQTMRPNDGIGASVPFISYASTGMTTAKDRSRVQGFRSASFSTIANGTPALLS